ncbi:glycosyltransferase family 61 protein [Candidatus Jidaibacter acanthamoebae]|nr:glycosyltransferase family 61 protein [Candidatus Jidaibacter acanthamoeba]
MIKIFLTKLIKREVNNRRVKRIKYYLLHPVLIIQKVEMLFKAWLNFLILFSIFPCVVFIFLQKSYTFKQKILIVPTITFRLIRIARLNRIKYYLPEWYTPPLSLEDSIPWRLSRFYSYQIFECLDIKYNMMFNVGSLLKSAGYFKISFRIFIYLTTLKKYKAYGYFGIADLLHLKYLWNIQYSCLTKNFITNDLNPNIKKVLESDHVVHPYKEVSKSFIESCYLKAINLKPSEFMFRWSLSNFYNDIGRYKDSIEQLSKIECRANNLIDTLVKKQIQNISELNEEGDNYKLSSRKLHKCKILDLQDYKIKFNNKLKIIDCIRHVNHKYYEIFNGRKSLKSVILAEEEKFFLEVENAEFIGTTLIAIGRKYILSETHHVGMINMLLFSAHLNLKALNFDKKFAIVELPNRINTQKIKNIVLYIPTHYNNYYHFIYEFIASLLYFLTATTLPKKVKILVPPLLGWQKQLLSYWGVGDLNFLELSRKENIIFNKLIILSNVSRSLLPSSIATANLANIQRKYTSSLIVSAYRKRYFLIRKGYDRKMDNWSNVIKVLKKFDFILIKPEDFSPVELTEIFSNAEVIASQGGAALSNIIFAPSNIKVIILASYDHYQPTYNILASSLKQKSYVVYTEGVSLPCRYYLWSPSELLINKRSFEKAIKDILSD